MPHRATMRRPRRASRPCLMALAVATLLACLPLLGSALPYADGHDMLFHLARIESIAQGLAQGQFPVRLYPAQAYGCGYPTGICYPDTFLYLPALLRLAGLPLPAAYVVLAVAATVVTCTIAFASFRAIFGSERTGLACTVLWLLFPYRLVDVFLRASVGEYLALAFLPAIAYGLWEICLGAGPAARRGWLALGCAMAGVVQSHVLSVVLFLLSGAPLVAVLLALSARTRPLAPTLAALAKAVAVCVGLSAFFVIPFLDYYLHEPLQVTHAINDVEQHALEPYQLIGAFWPFSGTSHALWEGTAGEMPTPLGCALALVAAVGALAVRSAPGRAGRPLPAADSHAPVGPAARKGAGIGAGQDKDASGLSNGQGLSAVRATPSAVGAGGAGNPAGVTSPSWAGGAFGALPGKGTPATVGGSGVALAAEPVGVGSAPARRVLLVALLLVSLVLAWMTTYLFPWELAGDANPLALAVAKLGSIQFPWRLVGPLGFLLVLVAGILATDLPWPDPSPPTCTDPTQDQPCPAPVPAPPIGPVAAAGTSVPARDAFDAPGALPARGIHVAHIVPATDGPWRALPVVCLALAVVEALVACTTFLDSAQVVTWEQADAISARRERAIGNGEYLSTQSRWETVDAWRQLPRSTSSVAVEGWEHDVVTSATLSARSERDHASVATLPLLWSSKWRARVVTGADAGANLPLVQVLGFVGVLLPAGFEGDVRLDFAVPVAWHVAEAISLVSLVVVAMLALRCAAPGNRAARAARTTSHRGPDSSRCLDGGRRVRRLARLSVRVIPLGSPKRRKRQAEGPPASGRLGLSCGFVAVMSDD